MFFFNFLWPKHALSFDKNEDEKKQTNETKTCLNDQKKNQNDIVLETNFYTKPIILAQKETFTLKKEDSAQKIKFNKKEQKIKNPYMENIKTLGENQNIKQKDKYKDDEIIEKNSYEQNKIEEKDNYQNENLEKTNYSKLTDYKYQDKFNQLRILKEKMEKEEGILFKKAAKNFVFSDGNINSSLMFIAEAPGEEEDLQGKPFVGKSGKLLRELLKQANILDFYIINVIPWRPPMNRTPSLDEINIMRPYVFEHIKIISPKIIVSVGTTSLRALLIDGTITALQNTIIKTQIGVVFPIYHPSYALRIYNKKLDLLKSLIHLKSILDNN